MSSLHGLVWIQYSEKTSRSIYINIYIYDVSQSKPNQKLGTNSIVWVNQMNMSPWIHRVDLQLSQFNWINWNRWVQLLWFTFPPQHCYIISTHIYTHYISPWNTRAWYLSHINTTLPGRCSLSIWKKYSQLCLPIYLSTATLDDIFFGWIALSQRSSNPACWHALFLGQLVISSSPVGIFRRFHFHPSAYVSQVSGYHGRFVTKNTNHNHIVCCF